MFILNNKPLPIDVPFESNGIHYPANWLRIASVEEKSAAGVTWVPDPVLPDDRFYWVSADGSAVPKSLDMLKPIWAAQCDQTAYAMLLTSDWMIVRKAESGTEVPADWSAFRADVRSHCTTNKEALNNADDFDTFVATATALVWPVPPDTRI